MCVNVKNMKLKEDLALLYISMKNKEDLYVHMSAWSYASFLSKWSCYMSLVKNGG